MFFCFWRAGCTKNVGEIWVTMCLEEADWCSIRAVANHNQIDSDVGVLKIKGGVGMVAHNLQQYALLICTGETWEHTTHTYGVLSYPVATRLERRATFMKPTWNEIKWHNEQVHSRSGHGPLTAVGSWPNPSFFPFPPLSHYREVGAYMQNIIEGED